MLRALFLIVAIAATAACGGRTQGTNASDGGEEDDGAPKDASSDVADGAVEDDAGCIDGALPPHLGAPFTCGMETCWSLSEYCSFATGGQRFDHGTCAPLPCSCGAIPTCACIPLMGYCTCATDDAGAMQRTCAAP
jgi:hypothetical protein